MFYAVEPSSSILSDKNAELIRFMRILRKAPNRVAEVLQKYTNTQIVYYAARSMSGDKGAEWAARFLFLNRACWGGIYRVNSYGQFNVPFGNSGRQLCSRNELITAAKCLLGAELCASDFEDVVSRATAGDVVYLDPPYTSKGQFNGFIRYNESLFRWRDQERLARVARSARRRGAFVAVSGAYHRDVLTLYEGWWALPVSRHSRVGRTLESRKVIAETVLLSRRPNNSSGLKLPILRVDEALIQSVPHHD